jgi:hypothetical protein
LDTAVNHRQLADAELDYQIYQHACKTLEQSTSREVFEQGYENGLFHFSNQKTLLADLLSIYEIHLQKLAGEWLASTHQASAYGHTPLSAALKLICKLDSNEH